MGLIINADDFGKNQNVNKAITECFNKGLINQTTVMVNMPGIYEAVELVLVVVGDYHFGRGGGPGFHLVDDLGLDVVLPE